MSASINAPHYVDVPGQLVSFRTPRRSFVLMNSKKRQVTVMFIGNMFLIPAANVITEHSDVDADGTPIPGSYVVEDHYVVDPMSNEEFMILDSARAVIHIMGLNPGPNGMATTASSPLALGGISLLPRHAAREMWMTVAREGERRAFLSDVDRARAFFKQLEETNSKRKAANMPATDDYNPAEYERYSFLIAEYKRLFKQDAVEAPTAVEEDSDLDEIEFMAFAKAKTMEIANRTTTAETVDKTKLAMELLDDPAVRIKLQKLYKIRKRGAMPVEVSRLQDQIAKGETSVDAPAADSE